MPKNPVKYLEHQSGTMSLAEIAAAEHVSLQSLRDLARRRALPWPVLKLGRQYRVPRRKYEEWLEGDSGEAA